MNMFGLVRESELTEFKRKNASSSEYHKGVIEDYKKTIENLEEDKKTLTRQNRAQQRRNDEKVEVLNEQLEAYEALQTDRLQVEKDKIELDSRDEMLTAKEAAYESFAKELKKVKEEAKTVADAAAKEGYSDGLADGLRKIGEITAEDRKQAMQVAALAASSHTPKAALKVAEGIRGDMMALNSGEDDEEVDE